MFSIFAVGLTHISSYTDLRKVASNHIRSFSNDSDDLVNFKVLNVRGF